MGSERALASRATPLASALGKAVDLIEPVLRADTEGDNLRNDVPEIFDNRDAIIVVVPTYEDSYIKVPKVLNKE
ncbi:hypothetical protein DH2020_027795 [Rehmannia glutinosa]|uniref:Uncharacterized protein n=1 Tax=Rehmannia glutinosa TaxID=99300 RepID=A0ABR0VXB1_REHGL